MTIQNLHREDSAEAKESVQQTDSQPVHADSPDLDRILAAVAEHDGEFVGDDRSQMWGWDLTGMWDKHGRVALSTLFGSDGRLQDAMVIWEHTVIGRVQADAFNHFGKKVDNPRDTSGDLDRVLKWIENIETILGQSTVSAAGYYVRALEGPAHGHSWILWDPDEQMARCTDWFCQASYYPASGVLGAEARS